MKGLFLDFLFPKGHQQFSKNLIECLQEISEVAVLTTSDYYKDYNEVLSNTNYIEHSKMKASKNRLTYRLNSLLNMKEAASYYKNKSWDYVLITSFETISFAYGRHFFEETDNFYLVHHNNTDELTNPVKLKIFKSYMNRVNHIVFEEFIQEYLVKVVGVKSEKVFLLPHPLNENNYINNTSIKYDCVGLSNSNDDDIIGEIINSEKRSSLLLNMNKKVVLKSRKHSYNNGYLEVINGFLEKNKYDECISTSKYIYMPFPPTFSYRMSGTLIDCLSNDKIVIGNDIPLIRYYASKYPSVCKVAANFNQLYLLLNSPDDSNSTKKDFKMFKDYHSKENIVKSLDRILND